MLTDEERRRAQEFVDSQDWVFAKTMADIPHYYCLKSRCSNRDDFEWFVQLLIDNSVPGTFFGRTFQYFFLDDWKYWIMDASPEECDLINREFQG